MTSISSVGFTDGETVAVTARSDGETHEASVTAWGINASIDVEVERSTLNVAPERVTLRITGWTGFETPAPAKGGEYDARLHEIIYYAEFGDKTGVTYNAPVNVLPQWSDRNKGFGPLMSHVYRKPGTYTITIWAYELNSDRQAKWEKTFTVKATDNAFKAEQTFYVSVEAVFGNAPPGAAQYTNIASALLDSIGNERTRIMLRSGETHTGLHDINLNQTNTPGDTHLHIVTDYDRTDDADTNTNQPELRSVTDQVWNRTITFRGFSHASDIVIQGIKFKGPWNSSTETGSTQYDGLTFFASSTQPRHILLDDCVIDGFHQCIAYANGNGSVPNNSGLTLHDSTVTNWSNFGVYVSGAAHVELLGMAMVQHVDARSGGGQYDKGTNDHGPIRFNAVSKMFVVVDGCDFFSRTGWFPNVPGYRTQQPCIRVNQDSQAGSWFNLQRTALEGGWPVIKLTGTNGAVTENIQNIIIEKFVIVGSHMTRSGIDLNSGGVTVRNGLMIFPNVPRLNGIFDPEALVVANAPVTNPAAANAPIKVYHNTIINQMQDSNAATGPVTVSAIADHGRVFQITEANNVLHQPNLNDPHIPHGPLDLDLLWHPREKGYKPSNGETNAGVLDKAYETPATTVQAGAPLHRSPALGAADQDPLLHYDIFGNKRPSIPSIGAMELK